MASDQLNEDNTKDLSIEQLSELFGNTARWIISEKIWENADREGQRPLTGAEKRFLDSLPFDDD